MAMGGRRDGRAALDAGARGEPAGDREVEQVEPTVDFMQGACQQGRGNGERMRDRRWVGLWVGRKLALPKRTAEGRIPDGA